MNEETILMIKARIKNIPHYQGFVVDVFQESDTHSQTLMPLAILEEVYGITVNLPNNAKKQRVNIRASAASSLLEVRYLKYPLYYGKVNLTNLVVVRQPNQLPLQDELWVKVQYGLDSYFDCLKKP